MASRWLFFFIFFCGLPGRAYQSLNAGFVYEQFDYTEEISSPLRSHEIGWLPLLAASYENRFSKNLTFEFDFRGTYHATTRYEGSDLSTQADVTAINSHTIIDGEILLSWFPDQILAKLFAGFAGHSWDRFLAYGTGYRERYTWTNFTFGAGVLAFQADNFRLWVEGAVRPVWTTQMKVIFSETVQSGQDTTLILGPRLGYLIRAPFEWEFSPARTLTVSGFYEEIRMGGSGTVSNSTPGLGGTIREPDSKLRQSGFSAVLGIWF